MAMLKWDTRRLENGLLECTCSECGYKKEIMPPKRDWTRCPECGVVLWYA